MYKAEREGREGGGGAEGFLVVWQSGTKLEAKWRGSTTSLLFSVRVTSSCSIGGVAATLRISETRRRVA